MAFAAPARLDGQWFSEAAAGWSLIRTQGSKPNDGGFTARFSVGDVTSPDAAVRFDLTIANIQQNSRVVLVFPCPSTGCLGAPDQARENTTAYTLTVNGDWNLVSRGRLYLVAGGGAYYNIRSLESTASGATLSAGVGTFLPISRNVRLFLESKANVLFFNGPPATLLPLSVGLRF